MIDLVESRFLLLRHRMRTHRVERGWSQEDLAREAGLSRVQIAKLESGKLLDPKLSTLTRIAIALDIPADDLVM